VKQTKETGIGFAEAIEILKAAEAGKEIEVLATNTTPHSWQKIAPNLGIICYHINAGRKLRVNEPPLELWFGVSECGTLLGWRVSKELAQEQFAGCRIVRMVEERQ